jgi:hypothetical protein
MIVFMKTTKALFGILTITLAVSAQLQAQFNYSINADNTVTITGYYGSGGVVTIPTNINGLTVTSVGTNAFASLASLTSVTIPGTVASVGAEAFYECVDLTNVNIGNGVGSIGDEAFVGTTLTSVTIPGSVTRVGTEAFSGCVDLTNVIIGNGVGIIGDEAFMGTTLTSVTIPGSVTSVGAEAFLGCRDLTNVSIGSGVTLGNGVTIIGNSAFLLCFSLTSLTLGNGVTSIGDEAFDVCFGLTNLIIPDSVTNIGGEAFDSCSSLTSLTLGNGLTSISGGVFESCYGLTNLIIPDSVTSIGTGAFFGCRGLTNVTIGNGVTNIESEAFYGCGVVNVTIGNGLTAIDAGAFWACPSLTSVYFTGNAPTYCVAFVDDEDPSGTSDPTVYYLLGTTGWTNPFCGVTTMLWNVVETVITEQPQSVVVNAFNSASFSVTASGSGPLSYQWLFNGISISGAASTSLTIPNVTQTNLGEYSVVVTNVSGLTTSSNAALSMYPFLATPFGGLVTDWGYTNTLSVGAWGTGPLTYQWFDNGAAIIGATNDTFQLSSIQFSNAGLYSVVVSDLLGSVTNIPEQVVVNPAGVSLGLAPTLTIVGVVGYSYIIQSTANLANTSSWATLTNLTLTQPIELWVDTNTDASLPANSYHFYRVLPGQ